ncbi:DUF1616 domain-containing protein [Chloroflexota bacterium]
MGIGFKNKFAGVWGKALSAILVLAILSTLGMLVYSMTNSVKEPFTEFYLLDLNGEAADYPDLLSVGEEGKVVVGIVNREQETVSYRLEVRVEGSIGNQMEAVTLENDGKWEETTGFTPYKMGKEQKVEFLLYRQGKSEVYRRLHLLVDVQ